MTLKHTLSTLVALGFVLAAASQSGAAQTVKLGVFDAQKLTQETAEGAKIQARLNALKEKKAAELKKLQEDIDKLQQDFVQTATSASDDKKKDLSLKIQRRQDELDSAQKAATREMQLEVEAAQEGWQRRVLGVLGSYGKEKGFTLIVPADVALFYSSTIDITEDLAKLIDSAAAEQRPPATTTTPKPAGGDPKETSPGKAPAPGK